MSEDDKHGENEEERANNPVHPARTGSRGEMDERARNDRRKNERRARNEAVAEERRSGSDRRSGKPRRKRSMNQYDMDAEVLEFVNAINKFKQSAGKAFPTWSEVLGILRELGYEKSDPENAGHGKSGRQ